MKRFVIFAVTFLSGLFYALEFFLPPEAGGAALSKAKAPVGEALMVIGAFAVGLGVIGVLRHHLKAVVLGQKGWGNSLALLIAMTTMAMVTIWKKYDPPDLAEKLYTLLFYSVYNQLMAAVFALLAFYVASAAFRAFRIKSLEAALMMGTALIVMLGQIPIGDPLSKMLGLPVSFSDARQWIMETINMAAQRGILIGTYVGMLAFSLRIWLSLDRDTALEKKS